MEEEKEEENELTAMTERFERKFRKNIVVEALKGIY